MTPNSNLEHTLKLKWFLNTEWFFLTPVYGKISQNYMWTKLGIKSLAQASSAHAKFSVVFSIFRSSSSLLLFLRVPWPSRAALGEGGLIPPTPHRHTKSDNGGCSQSHFPSTVALASFCLQPALPRTLLIGSASSKTFLSVAITFFSW